MRLKNKLKNNNDLYKALLKLGHCGDCAINKRENMAQLKLFCKYNPIIKYEERKENVCN